MTNEVDICLLDCDSHIFTSNEVSFTPIKPIDKNMPTDNNRKTTDQIIPLGNNADDSTNCQTYSVETPDHNLSKRQRRKLLKAQKYLETKSEKRKLLKEKRKKKKDEAIANGISLGPSRKFLKLLKMKESVSKQRVVIDMSFDDLMADDKLNKCLKQIHRCYSLNRRQHKPLQLYITSFTGRCKEIMNKNNGYCNWDVNFSESSYLEHFSKADIMYLTSESDNIIDSLDESKVYVIGGFVDHNSHKGMTYKMAIKNNINHARLAIKEYIKLNTRDVLTVDHVFEILMHYVQNGNWLDALINTIPARKRILQSNADTASNNTNSKAEEL